MEKHDKNPKAAAGFRGVNFLDRIFKVSKKSIRNWLEGVNAYILHKSRKKFPMNRMIVRSVD